jgi:hypothetical protein
MIKHLSTFPEDVAAFACDGKVTKADYASVFIPTIVDELKRHRKMRLYYEIAPDFVGFDGGAIWDDFAVGMEHITRWERVAVVTDVEWIERATQLFSLILPTTSVKIFPTSKALAARAWISAATSMLEHA